MRRILGFAVLIAVVLAASWSGTGAAKPADTYRVFADSLNVRSEPSIKADVAGFLQAGDVVTAADEAYGWLKISGSGVSGWVAGQYLKKVDGASSVSSAGIKTAAVKLSASSGKAVVQVDSLRMRSGPGTSYEVSAGLVRGDRLTVLDRDGDWSKVRTAGGSVGWVSSMYIAVSAGAAVETVSLSTGHSGGGLKGKTIVVDPGHGGSDPGMLGTTYDTMEKDLTLSTSLLLADQLRARGARVVMTRTKDGQKPELSKRVQISEANGADAFVSVHYNSSTKNTSGTLTFYYSRQKDEPLARAIEYRLGKNGIGLKSSGISFGDYHVLRENDRPAALVELGFLSNAKDEKLVRTASYQRKAADAIADGLEDYFD